MKANVIPLYPPNLAARRKGHIKGSKWRIRSQSLGSFICFFIRHMQTVITHNVLPFSQRCRENHKSNEEWYTLYTYECGFVGEDILEKEDRLRRQYDLYILSTPVAKELQKQAFIKFSQEYPDEARDLILNQMA